MLLLVIGIFKLGSERTPMVNIGTSSVHDKVDGKYTNDYDKEEANDDYIFLMSVVMYMISNGGVASCN